MASRHLKHLSKVLGATAWTSALKGGRQLVSPLNKVTRLVTGALSKGFVRVNLTFAYHLASIWKAQGVPGVVKRLKVTQVLMMQALAGRPHRSAQEVGVAIARTSKGLPRFIPSLHRRAILNGNTMLIRYWLTLLGLYRVLDMPGKFSTLTITTPTKCRPWIIDEIKKFVPEFLARAPFRRPSAENWRIKPLALFTSSPNGLRQGTSIAGSIVCAAQLAREGAKAGSMYTTIRLFMESWSSGAGGRESSREVNTTWLYEFFRLGSTPAAFRMARASISDDATRLFGRLQDKPEPAGKVRVFAMVDYLTQMVLHPLHRSIFSLLRKISQDGTFNQHRPLLVLSERARRGALPYARSIDLSAATDRFPIEAQVALLNGLYGDRFGPLWASLLVDRDYLWSPSPKQEAKGVEGFSVRYAAGQPMGAYSSWAVFSLTHHLLVQLASKRVGIKRWFRDYALLGDDLVIANRAVAREYLNLTNALDVPISAAKSLSSRNGSLEFAKRFIYKGIDVSPLALKEFDVAIRNLPSLIQMVSGLSGRTNVSLSSVMGALGFGYRVLGSFSSKWNKLGSRARNALLMLRSPQSPLGVKTWEEWIQLVTPFASKPFRHDIRDRISQSLQDRFNVLVLDYVKSLFPGVIKSHYGKYTKFYLKDFIKPREWMNNPPRPGAFSPAELQILPKKSLWETPGIKLWGDLILVPLFLRLAESVVDVFMKVIDPSGMHAAEVSRRSFGWLQRLKTLELPVSSWSNVIALLLRSTKDVALIKQLSGLEVFERPTLASKVPRDAQKLIRLFLAMGSVAGRSIRKRSNTANKRIR